MPAPEPMRVLVVDDDADTRANLRDVLGLDDHSVETAGSASELLARRDLPGFAAILLDRRLPDGDAEGLLPQLRAIAPDTAVLMVTGYADLQGAIAAMRHGAADYILKPINPDAIRASLARVQERLRLARAKEQSEVAFRTLIEDAPCQIVIIRPGHTVAYFSRFAEEVTGRTAGEIRGRDFVSALLPPEHHPAGEALLSRALAGQVVRGVELPVLRADGSARQVLWNARRLPQYEGQPAVLAVGQDITSLKEAQERTLQAERLAAIGQMMTGLAHESGNALARSQACLEMLALEVQDRPEALDLLGRIQKAQDHLQKLYDEVRNYAAPLALQREPCQLEAVWRQAWANLAAQREGRETRLREECAAVTPVCTVDAFRLDQVFRNIFENALAAVKGPVEITVECSEARLADQPALRVSVRDNGPGLGPEQRRRIFDPFFTTKTRGTGLGMAIAKRVVEAHGGQIAVGGRGPGAEIVITLPRGGPR